MQILEPWLAKLVANSGCVRFQEGAWMPGAAFEAALKRDPWLAALLQLFTGQGQATSINGHQTLVHYLCAATESAYDGVLARGGGKGGFGNKDLVEFWKAHIKDESIEKQSTFKGGTKRVLLHLEVPRRPRARPPAARRTDAVWLPSSARQAVPDTPTVPPTAVHADVAAALKRLLEGNGTQADLARVRTDAPCQPELATFCAAVRPCEVRRLLPVARVGVLSLDVHTL